MTDPASGDTWDAIQLDASDNVATALRPLARGACARIAGSAGQGPPLDRDIPRGHKFALAAVAKGGEVRKYGAAIGTATSDIAPGAHVHLHNLEGLAGREVRRGPDR